MKKSESSKAAIARNFITVPCDYPATSTAHCSHKRKSGTRGCVVQVSGALWRWSTHSPISDWRVPALQVGRKGQCASKRGSQAHKRNRQVRIGAWKTVVHRGFTHTTTHAATGPTSRVENSGTSSAPSGHSSGQTLAGAKLHHQGP